MITNNNVLIVITCVPAIVVSEEAVMPGPVAELEVATTLSSAAVRVVLTK
jgi:hypothetical protein